VSFHHSGSEIEICWYSTAKLSWIKCASGVNEVNVWSLVFLLSLSIIHCSQPWLPTQFIPTFRSDLGLGFCIYWSCNWYWNCITPFIRLLVVTIIYRSVICARMRHRGLYMEFDFSLMQNYRKARKIILEVVSAQCLERHRCKWRRISIQRKTAPGDVITPGSFYRIKSAPVLSAWHCLYRYNSLVWSTLRNCYHKPWLRKGELFFHATPRESG
jgi:hypothetical protein